jgi:heme-degrading monooxygenase HmoA
VITEQAVLDVKAGSESDFEAAFAEAQAIISSMPTRSRRSSTSAALRS